MGTDAGSTRVQLRGGGVIRAGLRFRVRSAVLTLALLAGTWAVLAAAAQPAGAYTFGAEMRQNGPEQMLFDWTTDHCESSDIPDLAARAFRDYTGLTQMIATHFVNHRYRGFDLNGVQEDCATMIASGNDPNPAAYNDLQWIASPYTIDGRTIYGLMHTEWRGYNHGQCSVPASQRGSCIYFGVGFSRSRNAGATYTRQPAPQDLVATSSYRFDPSYGQAGYSMPSNIVYKPDGYYYVMIGTSAYRAQQFGACLLRTRTIADPTSWRAWDGSGFNIRFIDPYVETAEPPEAHVCAPLANLGAQMTTSLTYNTYFGKYMVTGAEVHTDPSSGAKVQG